MGRIVEESGDGNHTQNTLHERSLSVKEKVFKVCTLHLALHVLQSLKWMSGSFSQTFIMYQY